MLVKSIGFLDEIKGDFTVTDGGSHVRVPAGTAILRIATAAGTFEIHPNASGEMALVSMRIDACSAIEARNLVQDATARVLDHIAFMAGTPILTGLKPADGICPRRCEPSTSLPTSTVLFRVTRRVRGSGFC